MTLDKLTQKHYDALSQNRAQWTNFLETAAIVVEGEDSSLLDDCAFSRNYELIGRLVCQTFSTVLWVHARELAEAELSSKKNL